MGRLHAPHFQLGIPNYSSTLPSSAQISFSSLGYFHTYVLNVVPLLLLLKSNEYSNLPLSSALKLIGTYLTPVKSSVCFSPSSVFLVTVLYSATTYIYVPDASLFFEKTTFAVFDDSSYPKSRHLKPVSLFAFISAVYCRYFFVRNFQKRLTVRNL